MKKTLIKRGCKSQAEALEPNAYYCIINPKNADDVEFLDKTTTVDVLDHPIDYEVVEEGEYYIPDGVIDTFLAPRFIIVKDLKDLPNDLEVSIEDELHYPENDDEAAAYLYNQLIFAEVQLPADKDTAEYIQENKGGWTPKIILEYRNSNGKLERMKNVEVKINGDVFHTNNDGFVEANKVYGTVSVYCSFYHYYTGNIVRTNIFEFLNVDRFNKIGLAKKNSSTIYLVISNNNLHCWYKAGVYQAVNNYNTYCVNNSIKVAESLNIWTSSDFSASSCPLFHSLSYLNQQSDPQQFFQNFLQIGFIIKNALYTGIINSLYTFVANNNLSPDLLILPDNLDSKITYSTCFHELSHYSHAIKRGGSFWSQVVYAESMNQINFKDPYYNGQYPDIVHAAKIGLAESWAYFMEAKIDSCYNYYYSLEYFEPFSIPSTNIGWIPISLYWDLMDNVSDNIILRDNTNHPVKYGKDNYNGNINAISVKKLYNIMTNSGCNSVSNFKTIFMSQYPSQAQQVYDLFSLYGY